MPRPKSKITDEQRELFEAHFKGKYGEEWSDRNYNLDPEAFKILGIKFTAANRVKILALMQKIRKQTEPIEKTTDFDGQNGTVSCTLSTNTKNTNLNAAEVDLCEPSVDLCDTPESTGLHCHDASPKKKSQHHDLTQSITNQASSIGLGIDNQAEFFENPIEQLDLSDGRKVMIVAFHPASENSTHDEVISESLSFPNVEKDFNQKETELEDSFAQNNLISQDQFESNGDTLRNNRTLVGESNFFDSGITVTLTREQFKKVSAENGQLRSYIRCNQERKEIINTEEVEEYLGYQDILRRANKTCFVYMKKKYDRPPTLKSAKMRIIKIYGRCKHNTCKRFLFSARFAINGTDDIQFRVLHDLADIDHRIITADQHRGKDRIKTKRELRKTTAIDFYRNKIKENKQRIVDLKDLNLAGSAELIRKISAEGRMDLRLDNDPLLALIKMSAIPDSYVYQMSVEPLTVILLSQRQVDVLIKASLIQGPLKLGADATGSVFAEPRTYVKSRKQVFMYSLVTQIKCDQSEEAVITFPLTEIFTTEHTTTNITINYIRVVDLIKRSTSRPIYSIVNQIITDFCLANVNACALAFNSMDIVRYLQTCSEYIDLLAIDPETEIKFVVIRFCSSHLAKAFYQRVDKLFPDKSDKNNHLCKVVLFALLNTRYLRDFYDLLKHFWIYLITDDFEEKSSAFANLKVKTDNCNGKNDQPMDISDVEETTNERFPSVSKEFKTIYENSPFYRDAFKDFENVVLAKFETLDDFRKHNEALYNFIVHFMRKYVTYAPMLGQMLTFKVYDASDVEKNLEKNRANNGVIEAHHKNTKAAIRKCITCGDPPIRIDAHITDIFKPEIEAKMLQFELQIPQTKTTRNPRHSATPKHNTGRKGTPGSRRSGQFSPQIRTPSSCTSSIFSVDSDAVANLQVKDVIKMKESYKKSSVRAENSKSKRKYRKVDKTLPTNEEMTRFICNKVQTPKTRINRGRGVSTILDSQNVEESIPRLSTIHEEIYEELTQNLKIAKKPEQVKCSSGNLLFKRFALKSSLSGEDNLLKVDANCFTETVASVVSEDESTKSRIKSLIDESNSQLENETNIKNKRSSPFEEISGRKIRKLNITLLNGNEESNDNGRIPVSSTPATKTAPFESNLFNESSISHVSGQITNKSSLFDKSRRRELEIAQTVINEATLGGFMFHDSSIYFPGYQSHTSNSAFHGCEQNDTVIGFRGFDSNSTNEIKQNLDIKFFENNLISNIAYYEKPRSEECNGVKVVLKHTDSLDVQSISKFWLNAGTEWLTNFGLEFSLRFICRINQIQASVLFCDQGKMLFGFLPSKDYDKESINNILAKIVNKPIVIIPIHFSSHFTAAVIDFMQNRFYFFDSLNSAKSANEMHNRILATAKQATAGNVKYENILKRISELHVMNITQNKQSDGYNCGIFVIKNIKNLIENKHIFERNFDPKQFRKTFVEYLIRHSDNVEHNCAKCMRDRYEQGIEWTCCKICRRIWDKKCATSTVPEAKMKSVFENFVCIMCKHYVR